MKPNIHIRKANREDAAAAYGLIKELAEYEKAPQEVTVSLEEFVEDGFGPDPIYQLLVAEAVPADIDKPKVIVGIALFYVAYSTWKGKMVYLDDLVVTENYRQLGIGQQLIDAVFDFARRHHANQVRWHVLNWNEPAIKFYEKMGTRLEEDWITCKFGRDLLYKR